jgi:AcrR family transcriptional regulator
VTATRAAPRQRRSAEKVDAIVAAARAVLVEGGELTTGALARRAGVAIGTVYRYFADVDAVVDVVLAEHARRAAAAVEAALTATGPAAPTDEVFAAVLDAHLGLYDQRPDLARALADPALAERHRRIEEASDRALVGRLATTLGLAPDDEARLAAAWRSVGAHLGTVLVARPAERRGLEADLRALVAHHATRF